MIVQLPMLILFYKVQLSCEAVMLWLYCLCTQPLWAVMGKIVRKCVRILTDSSSGKIFHLVFHTSSSPHIRGKACGLQEVYWSSTSFLQFERKCGCLKHDIRHINNKAVIHAFLTCWLERGISLFSGICKKKKKIKLKLKAFNWNKETNPYFSTPDIPAFALIAFELKKNKTFWFFWMLWHYISNLLIVLCSPLLFQELHSNKKVTQLFRSGTLDRTRAHLSYFKSHFKNQLFFNHVHCFNLLYTLFKCDLT